MTSQQIFIVLALVLAIGLDFALIFWLRRKNKQRLVESAPADQIVYLLGTYSPVLTWLKYRRLPQPASGKSTAKADETQVIKEVAASDERIGAKEAWVDWAIITGMVFLFCSIFLNLGSSTRLPGLESEFFQILDWILVNSLRNFHQFPLWNPYNLTGLPYIADPMLHIYNPVVTVPVLLFGVQVGYKLAIFFSFLLAALGMWWLGAVLGLGRPARIWMALMYAFAGQPVARFFQGEFLFVLAFAWIPWIIASLILVTKTRRRAHIALTAIFMALFFFCGNAYYQFILALILTVFGLVMVIHRKPSSPFVQLDLGLVKIYFIIGLLALGMVAIQLIPLAQFWPRLSKDMEMQGSHTLYQIFLDYTSKDASRFDAYSVLPAREEFYAYIGYIPFIGLLLLPFAFKKRDRKILIFFCLLLLLSVVWIATAYMPWRDLFAQTKFLAQFRHVLRALIFGSFALIVLAGLGLDTVWKLLSDSKVQVGTDEKVNPSVLASVGKVAIGLFMLIGVIDVFSTNRPIMLPQDVFKPAYSVLAWLKQYDSSDYYVQHNPTNGWYDASISTGFRYINEWFPYADIRDQANHENTRPVEAQPLYITQLGTDPPPDNQYLSLVNQVEGFNIYRDSESLPMAFIVDNASLVTTENPGPLLRHEVQPLTPYFPGPNDIEIISQGGENQTLVVLSTLYPGWNVEVDGRPAALRNISGYMAVDALSGTHRYTFSFRPRSFFIGLLISLIFTFATFFLLVTDLHLSRDDLKRRWLAARAKGNQLKQLPARALQPPGLSVDAIYADGILMPTGPIDLPEEAKVRISVVDAVLTPKPAMRRWVWATASLTESVVRAIPLDVALCAVGLVVYLSTRLIGLTSFPIYFFTDEAVQTVMAADFLHNDFKNYSGEQWPTYFNVDPTYNLSSVSVYLQVIPYILFGKSEFVTRAVSVLAATFGALMLGLMLRNIFKLPFWWCGIMLLSIAPVWFLHSRTAFEPVEMVAFYVGYLYFYLLYRNKSPRYLYAAIVMAVLTFYTYSPGQLVVVLTSLGFFFSDLRYHWQNRGIAFRGLLLIGILALPYFRFTGSHPKAMIQGLSARAPYWVAPGTLSSKLEHFGLDYLRGFDPRYWFLPNNQDLVRHLMKGYGHLLWWTFPLFILGLALAIKGIRSSAFRAILIALIVSPVGGGLAGVGFSRVLVFIIPATVLTALGLDFVLTKIEKLISYKKLSLAVMAIFILFNIGMLRDALVNGPTWFHDYSLGGMQYGAKQVFGSIQDFLSKNPSKSIIVSPSWANGTDILARFFSPDPLPYKMGTIDEYMYQHIPLDSNTVFVMIPDEYNRAVSSGKFKDVNVLQTLPYPDRKPGFYFVSLNYADNIDTTLSAEKTARMQLEEADVTIDGKPAKVKFSRLDMGNIQDVWDGDPNTVARTLEANPFVIEITFSEPRTISGFNMVIGDTEDKVSALVYATAGGDPATFTADLKGSLANPQGSMDFGKPITVQELRLEVNNVGQGVPGHVHLWEIYFH